VAVTWYFSAVPTVPVSAVTELSTGADPPPVRVITP
jgi:hypothetical protein